MSENSLYQDSYGMNLGKRGPDFERCCVEVGRNMGRWTQFGQCQKKRGYGPDAAYCKIHDPVAVKARSDKASASFAAQHNKDRYRYNGPAFYEVLKQIAEGHNDARGLAQETIREFHKGEMKP